MNNFNSFEGYNELDFSGKSKKKNVILIGGKNGAGKTSLFNAIKIALYGPLTFGYIGINPHYISKVKDYINSRAFQTAEVTSMVQLSITMIIDREIKDYIITREWDYTNKKFEERFSITEGRKLLSEDEVAYFQNYLLSRVPPDLFEFFFFDGEEVGTIFSTPAYSKYIKNAIFKLNGLDTFENIRKLSAGYAGDDTQDTDISSEFANTKKELDDLECRKKELADTISDKNRMLDEIQVALVELETEYKKSGGLTNKEKKALAAEFSKNEQVKADAVSTIKSFVEGLMPFYIVNGFISDIEKQIEIEERIEIANIVKENIVKERVIPELDSRVSEKNLETVIAAIHKLFSVNDAENVELLYNLSKDESRQVNAIISNVKAIDKEKIISAIESRKSASARNTEINSILKSSLSDDESSEYLNRENELLRNRDVIQNDLNSLLDEQRECETEYNEVKIRHDSLKKTIEQSVQTQNIYKLSSAMTVLMESLLESKTRSIRSGMETEIVNKLKCIFRKNNLITHVEIDPDFSFNLYQDAVFSADELVHLYENVGDSDFRAIVGRDGLQRLFTACKTNEVPSLIAKLRKTDKSFELYKQIELDKLSKGERQVFILSFYWSVIELSEQEIPFIIDTPYARIDAEHRKGISKYFFPNISDQVIILSTDEEISEEYYEIIKPYVNKEYLLVNDKSQNRTTIMKGYFFG